MVVNRKLWIFVINQSFHNMKNIGVFCSSSNEIDDIYVDSVSTIGKWLGENKKTLIYGGVDRGLMEVIAKQTHKHGGKVIGLVPDIIKDCKSQYADEIIITKDLSERKDRFLELSDIVVALPGGIGTLDEIFHTLACATLDYNPPRVILYNINGFYSNLLTCLAEFKKHGFIKKPLSELFTIANTESELKSLLK